jgi:hypothetical protein
VDYYVHCCLDACPLGQVQALVPNRGSTSPARSFP